MFTDVTYQDWLAAADRDRLLLTAIDRYKAALERGWTGYQEIFTQELTPWESMKNESLLDDEIFIGGAA